MLSYQIEPGQGAGILQLGDSLWHILDELRTRKTEYPRVEIAYDPANAKSTAVTVHLPHLTLYFPHSIHQTLQRIVFHSLPASAVTLLYESHDLHSATSLLTKARVSKLFGPTHASGNGSQLAYPGISFEVAEGSGTGGAIGKVTVAPRNETAAPALSLFEALTMHIPEPLEIVIGQTTSQDLLLDLGSPLRKYWKEDDRMERMWGEIHRRGEETSNSCFWNYFQYGLDFLISAEGLVEKVICHSNIPGTPSFQRYARCPWSLPDPSDPGLPARDFASPSESFPSRSAAVYSNQTQLRVPGAPSSSAAQTSYKADAGKKRRTPSPATASADSREGGKETQTLSTQAPAATLSVNTGDDEDAMILDRTVEGGLEDVTGLSPSRLIGLPGLIIEEDQLSGGIVSVLVYKEIRA